jgi:hypothetical protein
LRLEAIQTCIIPVLIYCSQTWTFTKRQTQVIQIYQRKMEREVLGINLKDRMWNEELRGRSGIEDAAKAARRQKMEMGRTWTRRDGHTPRQFGTRE